MTFCVHSMHGSRSLGTVNAGEITTRMFQRLQREVGSSEDRCS